MYMWHTVKNISPLWCHSMCEKWAERKTKFFFPRKEKSWDLFFAKEESSVLLRRGCDGESRDHGRWRQLVDALESRVHMAAAAAVCDTRGCGEVQAESVLRRAPEQREPLALARGREELRAALFDHQRRRFGVHALLVLGPVKFNQLAKEVEVGRDGGPFLLHISAKKMSLKNSAHFNQPINQ